MSMISAIPNDVLVNILSRLPVKPVLRFRRVCKGWRSLIDSDDFVEAHLSFAKLHEKPSFVAELDEKFYFFDAHDLHFVVSMKELWQSVPLAPLSGGLGNILSTLSWFDGLCCMGMDVNVVIPKRPRIYQIINPATRTSVKLPKSGLVCPEICQIVRDPVTRVYKLLVVESMYPKFRAEIFSIGVDASWRKLDGAFGCHRPLYCRPFVNGAIHWIFHPMLYRKTGRVVKGTPVTIVAFDVSQESFLTIRPPEGLNVDENFDFVADFRGSLCLLHFDVPGLKMEFWVLQDYDNSVWVMGLIDESEDEIFNISYNPDHETFETVEPRVANELEYPIFNLYIESLAGRNTTGHENNADSGGGGDGDDDDDDDDYDSFYDPGTGDGVNDVEYEREVEFGFDWDDGNGGDGVDHNLHDYYGLLDDYFINENLDDDDNDGSSDGVDDVEYEREVEIDFDWDDGNGGDGVQHNLHDYYGVLDDYFINENLDDDDNDGSSDYDDNDGFGVHWTQFL
ncbi:putative F-box protein [Nymphaea thermarum]|nr:putative F-box protein [Nymphaea thermarum]